MRAPQDALVECCHAKGKEFVGQSNSYKGGRALSASSWGQCLVNAVTVHVGTGTNMSGLPTSAYPVVSA